MGRLVVIHNVTLDGVDQAPGRPDEDDRGGFPYGGWAVPYSDDAMGRVMADGMGGGGALLFGRRTYQDFAAYWPRQSGNPFTEVLDRMPKYVASGTLRDPLPWRNSTLLQGPVPEAVIRIKEEVIGSLVVLGSGNLVRTLAAADLVDEYVLLTHPLTLGTGRRLFPDGGPPTSFALRQCTPTTTGVVIATYGPVGNRSEAAEVIDDEAVPAEH